MGVVEADSALILKVDFEVDSRGGDGRGGGLDGVGEAGVEVGLLGGIH